MGRTSVTNTKSLARTSAKGRQRTATVGTDKKRERILRVAEQLFGQQGYAHTTLDQIAGELGVTKPYLYYYFRNKQELFEILSWRPTVACFTALDFAPDDPRPAHVKVKDGLTQLIRATVMNHPSAFFAYRDPQAFRPEMRKAQKKIANHFYDKLCTLLEQARQEGQLHFDETKITALAACSIPGFLYHWYQPDGRLSPDDMVKALAELAFRVIGLRTSF